MRGSEAQFKALVAIWVFVQQETEGRVAGSRRVEIVSSMVDPRSN